MTGRHSNASRSRAHRSNPIAIALAVVIASSALAVAILIVGQPDAARGENPVTQTVDVYFTTAEEVMPLGRSVPANQPVLDAAIESLLAGPTAAEKAQGFGTDIPSGTELRSTRVNQSTNTAVIDLSSEFEKPTGAGDESTDWEQRGRVVQVVLTAQSAVQVDRVTILVEGKPHMETSTQALEQTAADTPVTAPTAPNPSQADVATIREAQERLVELKYLPSDAVTGKKDYRTEQAVMAFQAWEGLGRDGDVGPKTTAALKAASAPVPKNENRSGRSTQIYRDKGVVLLVEDGRLVRAVHTSTGGPGHTTPAGSYKIYSKERNHMSRQYNVNLPYCQFFYAGYAFHEYPNVPAQPASHGCARLPAPEAPEVWEFTEVGTPVTVY